MHAISSEASNLQEMAVHQRFLINTCDNDDAFAAQAISSNSRFARPL